MPKSTPRGEPRASTAARIALTEAIVTNAVCPDNRAVTRLWDDRQAGLVLHVYPSGSRAYYVSWRQPGGGRRQRLVLSGHG